MTAVCVSRQFLPTSTGNPELTLSGEFVTLAIEGAWTRFDEGRGAPVNALQAEVGGLFDTELVKDLWFLAVNIGAETERSRTRRGAETETERQSGFEASFALSRRVGERGTVGLEAGYLAAFQGAFFARYEGSTLYVGPTASAYLSDKMRIRTAFQKAGCRLAERWRLKERRSREAVSERARVRGPKCSSPNLSQT